jgi:hypothetical protein
LDLDLVYSSSADLGVVGERREAMKERKKCRLHIRFAGSDQNEIASEYALSQFFFSFNFTNWLRFEVSVLCIIVLGLSICDLYGISLFQFSQLIIGNENFVGFKERNLMEIKLVKNMNMYIYIYNLFY